MKKFVFAICAMTALAGAVSVCTASEYKYVFVPSSTTDGTPLADWGGALFLDAPMSSGGSLTDIDQSDSFLKTEYGSFYLDQSSDVAIHSVGNPKVAVPFTWTASTVITPGTITSMDITGFGPLKDKQGSVYGWEITQDSLEIGLTDPTANGMWVAAVPDFASTAFLIGLAGAGLCGFGYFSRIRHLAMARR